MSEYNAVRGSILWALCHRDHSHIAPGFSLRNNKYRSNTLHSLISLTCIQSLDTNPHLLILGPQDIPKGHRSRAVKVKGHRASEGVLIVCANSPPTWNRLAHEDTLCCGRLFVLPELSLRWSLERSYFQAFFSSGLYLISVLDTNKAKGFTNAMVLQKQPK